MTIYGGSEQVATRFGDLLTPPSSSILITDGTPAGKVNHPSNGLIHAKPQPTV
jgi:hypothetical protein